MTTLDYLEKLLAFDTTSAHPNIELIMWVKAELDAMGCVVEVISSVDGRKANLFATVGPLDQGGVMLSGHTDVVPVNGQKWTLPPFAMTCLDGKVYGRGAADMKGFVAARLSGAP